MAKSNTLSDLLLRARPAVEQQLAELPPPYTLFFSVSDGKQRARVCHGRSDNLDALWLTLASQARKLLKSAKMEGRWLRIDWVTDSEAMNWQAMQQRFRITKRGYFRYGLALDPDWKTAFLEQELNGNAMLYGGNKIAHVVINQERFRAYTDKRFGKKTPLNFDEQAPVTLLSTAGIFLDSKTAPQPLYGPGRNAGRRIIEDLDEATSHRVIDTSTRYLASQVLRNGRFEYGWHCCFDRAIGTYNTLRHASSTYAMIEGWEVISDQRVKKSIDRALHHLTTRLIKKTSLSGGDEAAFLVEANGEIKLGGNAVCLLAMVKYTELTGSEQYRELMEQLALGIQFMQDEASGKFVHVLKYPELSMKDEFRIIYYDGEAAFGLMRLYGLTKDPRWLGIVEKAFEYFIANNHWEAHDHWLSYCVNELTLYRPEARYYQFGIQNVSGYLDFVLDRITTFPTLLELMMAAERMVTRLRNEKEFSHLLQQLDLRKFYRALHTRAMYLLNGYFWPEYAMYFKNPDKITGSFYIRHHAFRVRIDDVEHYLSGFVAFRKYLLKGSCPPEFSPANNASTLPVPVPAKSEHPVLAWGGDVNLARRQHYRLEELGEETVLGKIPALNHADLSVINLECVVATSGEQGVDKGEGSPYYYRARPEMLRLLCHAGIDMVTTANNHSGDYGNQALLEQGFWLDELGIAHTGSGSNLEAALTPAIRPAGDLNVAIFSIDATQKHFAASARGAGCAYLPLRDPEAWMALLKPRITAARAKAQVVLVAVHWGANLEEAPTAAEISIGRSIIDAGADGVLGTSAHVLQGIEIYRDRPIIHDAGDLLFDSVRRKLKDSGIFQLALSHRGVENIRFFPVGCGFGFSQQLDGRKGLAVSQRYAEKCHDLGTEISLMQDGTAQCPLTPPNRASAEPPLAQQTRYNQAVLDQIRRPPNKTWTVDQVPADTAIPAREFGPLRLIGMRSRPQIIDKRQLIFVETFWTLAEPTTENLRLDIRAVPVTPTSMPYWGKSMDHDPCDWQMPTSSWQTGVIYRDYYGLRPPASRQLRNGELQIQIGIKGSETVIDPVPINDELITLRILTPEKPSKSTGVAGSKQKAFNTIDGREPPTYRSEFPLSIFRQTPGQTWNAQQIADVTGGDWLVPPPQGWFTRSVVSGQSFIEQSLTPAMFVAHKSSDRAYHERSSPDKYTLWDLHEKLPDIVMRTGHNLSGVIVQRPVAGLPEGLPVLQVADPIKAIIELGLAARYRYSGDVIAITGTAGKSSTVKMLRDMLGGKQRALSSLGNYNSRVGAPSMLASLSAEHQAAVIEVAQSALWMKQGPITRRIHPTIAMITEVGVSQTSSRVKSTKDTALWKSRIFDGLIGRAVAIVGEHLPHFDYILEKARQHAKRVIIFGPSDTAEVRVLDIQGDGQGSRVLIEVAGEPHHLNIPAPSIGMVNNAVAALCAIYAMGRSIPEAAATLEQLKLDEGHLDQIQLRFPGGNVKVIDDSWNATVSSMLNAFSVLGQIPLADSQRKIAVLGRMVALGDEAEVLHGSLATPLIESGVQLVITHGDEMRYLRVRLPDSLLGPHFESIGEMANYLMETASEGDLILIKGSRRDSDFGNLPAVLKKMIDAGVTA
ncbi:CapA family protein [Microbulbifer mangrovi]|uniref:CapA family protein n=1 Tax=Microbulbifer mangrovi TaxID=927787 RepID=UPI00099062EA|nr:CapA family protein [Microbulbifer mangrovi]